MGGERPADSLQQVSVPGRFTKVLTTFHKRALPLRNRAPIFWKSLTVFRKSLTVFRKSLTVFLESLTDFRKSVSVFRCASACEGWVKVRTRVAVVQLAVG